MSAAHGRHEAPVPGEGRRARTRSTIAAAAAFLASLGALIYVLAAGTDLQPSVFVWVGWTALLGWVIVRRRSERSVVWTSAGAVAWASWQVISDLARQNAWPADQRHLIALAGDWMCALTVVLVVVWIVTGIRSGELTWPPWRLSDKDRADLTGLG